MKRFLVAMFAIAALIFASAGASAAQDGPAIEADPASVAEAGEHTITINGSGYTGPLFVLPCPGAGGDPAAIAEDSCDLNALAPAAPDDDGNFSIELTVDIPEEGLVIVGGNADQTEVGATVVGVGGEAMDDGEAEAMADDDGEAEAMDDASSDLPATGLESALVIVIGAALLAAGALVVRSGRDISRI